MVSIFSPEPTAANNAKRALKLRQAYPDRPKSLESIALEAAVKACERFLPPVSTKTVTAKATSTATTQGTLQSTTTASVPSTTSTMFAPAVNTVTAATSMTETVMSIVPFSALVFSATTTIQANIQASITIVLRPTQTITSQTTK